MPPAATRTNTNAPTKPPIVAAVTFLDDSEKGLVVDASALGTGAIVGWMMLGAVMCVFVFTIKVVSADADTDGCLPSFDVEKGIVVLW